MCTQNRVRTAGHTLITLVVTGLFTAGLHAGTPALTLAQAETIALRADPSVQAVESRREALQEMAIAAGQLPDPMLQAGLMSLPTDSWALGQEDMTQVVVGISQKFPRGRTRELRAEQTLERAQALDETVSDRRLQIELAVREDFVEVLKQIRLAEINAAARQAFADLASITLDFYATGRVQQQDVLLAAVELAKVEDRATRIAEDEDRARARLEAWIGTAAWEPLAAEWPEQGAAPTLELVRDALLEHPRIAAFQRRMSAAETGVELARQRYRPEFGIDLTYGARGGTGMDGSSRPDLFSVMLVMDLPLFHENRQDRYVAASAAEASASLFERDDMYRQMLSEAALHTATLGRQQERRKLFEERLLPDAEFNAAATFAAYQAALDDLTTLMRARITEYDLQLDYAELIAEMLKTRARLDYLKGGA